MVRPSSPEDERVLLDALRRRDEAAFAELVRRYAGSMLRLARLYARSAAVAEEVVQEAWLGVLQGSSGSRAGRPSRRGCSGSS